MQRPGERLGGGPMRPGAIELLTAEDGHTYLWMNGVQVEGTRERRAFDTGPDTDPQMRERYIFTTSWKDID